jgi:hypothetical protein
MAVKACPMYTGTMMTRKRSKNEKDPNETDEDPKRIVALRLLHNARLDFKLLIGFQAAQSSWTQKHTNVYTPE